MNSVRRAHVRELIEIFAPGGGFVFCQVHNIQANVPPANVLAMYEALEEVAGNQGHRRPGTVAP
jgi:uroporphyrinogen-III decarboxylase